jgi:hypothetical protein
MPSDHEIYRDLGAHDAEITNLKEQVSAIRQDVSEIKVMLSEAKGGWKVLMAVGGIAAALSSAATSLIFKLMHWNE